jgi:hypothetical protein
VPILLMLTSGVGLVAATAALWVQGWRRADHRFFAGLISIAVTLSSFSVVCLGGGRDRTLASYLGTCRHARSPLRLRLYRQLLEPPPGKHCP